MAGLAEGQPSEAARDQVMQVVRSTFRPEFLNRLDEIILFNRLQPKDMTHIVEIQLKRLQALLDDRKIVMNVEDSAKEWLAKEGYNPVYGARPLKRVIQQHVQNPLATKILEGEVGDKVRVEANENGVQLVV